MFYNYSALYFNAGYELFMAKKFKDALRYFRTSMWGFQQVKRNVQSANTSGLLLPEFQLNFIDSLASLAEAFAYICFYNLWKAKFQDSNPDQECTLHTSVIKCLDAFLAS